MLEHQDPQWLDRLMAHSVGLFLINQSKTRLDRETLEHLRFTMEHEGALVVWGSPDGLDEVFDVRHHQTTDLYLCGSNGAPVPDATIELPKRPVGLYSPSFPASLSTWAVLSLSRPGDLVLGIGTIRGQVAEVGRASGRKVLELATKSAKVIPPEGGWEGYPELTDEECLERFNGNYVLTETGCHLWRGKPDQDGYGRYSAIGAQYKAHRYAYAAEFGPLVNPRLPLGHECGNRLCVNPYHLHLEPIPDNTAEAWRDRRARERAGK